MKSPRYTAGVVKTYGKYVDLYLEKGRAGYEVDPQDRRLLLDLFDRGGFTEGYYEQHNGPHMIARKEKPAFRQGNEELFHELDRLYVNSEKKIPIKGKLIVREGQETALQLRRQSGEKETAITVWGAAAQKAKNQPAVKEQLAKQIRKTGNTLFFFEDLEVELEGQAFVPVQMLNELRRQGLECLRKALLEPFWRHNTLPEPHLLGAEGGKGDKTQIPRLHVLLSGKEGLFQVLEIPEVWEVMVEADGIEPEDWKETAALCHDRGKRCVLAMPVIFREQAERYFDRQWLYLSGAGFDGILVRAWEELEYFHHKNMNISLYGDHNLYIFNHLSKETLLGLGCGRVTFPLELNDRELKDLGGENSEIIGYGLLPAMVSAQCVTKTVSGCRHKPGWVMMKDRTGKELPVRNHCQYCYNVIYNPDPLSLIDQREQLLKLGCEGVRLMFTRESPKEVGRITKAWADMLGGRKTGESPLKDFTRGHFKRGVE